MIFGAHVIVSSQDASADRAFFRDVLGYPSERGVRCSEVEEARWGSVTKIQLPGGGTIGLYQPKHPTALQLRP
jgi:hypothetical protein